MDKSKTGKLVWFDLTVPDAVTVSKFYEEVVGWTRDPLSMGTHDDYVMKQPVTGEGVSGVCHAKGSIAYLPPQWLLYIQVEDLDQSLEKCTLNGGKVIGERMKGGPQAAYCLIQDPAGAYMMLFEGEAQPQ